MSAKRSYPGVVVRQTGKGTSISIRYFDGSGKRKFVQLGYAPEWSRKRAYDELKRRQVAAESGHVELTDKTTLGEFATDWFERYTTQRGLKPNSISYYKTIVNRHLIPGLGHIQLRKLKFQDIEKFMTGKLRAGLSPRTVNTFLQALGVMLKDAQKRGLIASNPATQVDRVKENPQPWRILSPVEFRAVAAAFGELEDERAHFSRVAFLLMFELGIRRGEMLGLRWSRVRLADPAGPTLRIEATWAASQTDTPKSSTSSRTLRISEALAGQLMDLRAASDFDGDDDYVFPSSTGRRPMDMHKYADLFRKACKAAGIEDGDRIRPCHDLRHSSLTNGAISGMSPASLQARAGHSSYSTTQLYVNLSGHTFEDEEAKLTERLYGAHENDAASVT